MQKLLYTSVCLNKIDYRDGYIMNCFKSYDIRGKVPEELNKNLAYEIGKAYAQYFKPGKVIIGRDVRLESPILSRALIDGLNSQGVSVIDIGVCGTEEVYFHSFNLESSGVDGGIMVTASHNPKGHNGMKMVGKGASPVYEAKGLKQIKEIIENNIAIDKSNTNNSDSKVNKESHTKVLEDNSLQEQVVIDEDKTDYIEYLLKFIDISNLRPLKIVVNPGNGPAGSVVKLLQEKLPFKFTYILEKPDGNFPNGVPNPMLAENQKLTSEAVLKHGADLGIAWDGDFDRCFFFDEKGKFIDGYYIVGLIAEMLLTARNQESQNNKPILQESIIYDPRLTWNTLDIVGKHKAKALQSRSGHSYIKETMRKENAIYGGEMSAHHYFRDFGYCDSGMLPWLLITQLLCNKEKPLSELLQDRMNKFPCSGEINFKINTDPAIVLEKIMEFYKSKNPVIDRTDGISLEMPDWRFNIRMSNTEPLMRLNAESKGDKNILDKGVQEIRNIISEFIDLY